MQNVNFHISYILMYVCTYTVYFFEYILTKTSFNFINQIDMEICMKLIDMKLLIIRKLIIMCGKDNK